MNVGRNGMTKAAWGFAMALGALVGGCSTTLDKMGALVADPMQYEFYNCQTLVGLEGSYKARLKQLDELMTKSSAGAGGEVVNAVAYKPEYVTVSGQMNAVRTMQAEKNCPPPPAPAAPSPAKPAKPTR